MAAAGAAAGAGGLGFPAQLPDEFELPDAFKGGDLSVVPLNETLAGLFGAIAQHIKSVRTRGPMRARVHDLGSFDSETQHLIKELRDMRTASRHQAAAIEAMGGVPFPVPDALSSAMNALLPPEDAGDQGQEANPAGEV